MIQYKYKEAIVMYEENELDSTCGVSDDELTKRFVEAIRIDNEIKKIKGIPIQKYDNEKKQPYLEYPDGRREYV
ncbi:hypothetical protein [Hominilimicola sp.]|jgi:hypothetical protein|uniref:hypothetical protein n=1 Tax=Hominilimicola sp. TaxID=3073571 RepID=UPI00399A6E37